MEENGLNPECSHVLLSVTSKFAVWLTCIAIQCSVFWCWTCSTRRFSSSSGSLPCKIQLILYLSGSGSCSLPYPHLSTVSTQSPNSFSLTFVKRMPNSSFSVWTSTETNPTFAHPSSNLWTVPYVLVRWVKCLLFAVFRWSPSLEIHRKPLRHNGFQRPDNTHVPRLAQPTRRKLDNKVNNTWIRWWPKRVPLLHGETIPTKRHRIPRSHGTRQWKIRRLD